MIHVSTRAGVSVVADQEQEPLSCKPEWKCGKNCTVSHGGKRGRDRNSSDPLGIHDNSIQAQMNLKGTSPEAKDLFRRNRNRYYGDLRALETWAYGGFLSGLPSTLEGGY